jgi:hypothetical protein
MPPRRPVPLPPDARDVERAFSRARASETIAEHERHLFPAAAILELLAIVDAMHASAVERGDGADILERLDDAATELECALRDGASAAHEAAEAWHEIGVATRRADDAIRMLGDLLADCGEAQIVSEVAAKRR